MRLGCGEKGWDEVKQHPWFKGINWDDVLAKKLVPPIRPNKVRVFRYSSKKNGHTRAHISNLTHRRRIFLKEKLSENPFEQRIKFPRGELIQVNFLKTSISCPSCIGSCSKIGIIVSLVLQDG